VRPDGGHAAVCGHDVVSHAHQVRQLTGLTGQYASVADEIAVVDHGAVIATGTPSSSKPGPARRASASGRPAQRTSGR
jgi:oleandomycin transport system ATP-binding protein